MAVEISEKAITIIKAMQAGAEGLCGKELAEVCGLAPRAVTGVVNGLVKRGLAQRQDGNPKTIWLTDEGRAYHIPNSDNTVEVKEAEQEDEDVEPTDADLEAIEHGSVTEMMDDLLDYDKVDEDTQRIIDNIRQDNWEEF